VDFENRKPVLGRYEILSTLGEGRFGKIFKVRDLRTGEVYALKEAKDVNFAKNLLEEAQNVLLLDHPNLVKLYRYHLSRDRRKIYLVYEYCDGGDLGAYAAAKGGRLDLSEALEVLRQVTAGLAYLHSMGFIHMDIKPENVLSKLEDKKRIWKLGDFGLLKPRGYYGILDVKGTVGYIAPEVFRGEIHRSSDVYSLGCLLYFMLEGHHPFYDADKGRELAKNRAGKIEPPPALKGRLLEIFKRMTDPDPMRRYRTAGELLKELNGPKG